MRRPLLLGITLMMVCSASPALAAEAETAVAIEFQFKDRLDAAMGNPIETVPVMLDIAEAIATLADRKRDSSLIGPKIDRWLRMARDRIDRFAQLADEKDPTLLRLRKRYQEGEKTCERHEQACLRAIRLASGKSPDVPRDAYRGKDKEKLRALVTADWKKRFPGDHIVSVRFPSPNWRPKEYGIFYDYQLRDEVEREFEPLDVAVVVRSDAKTATIYSGWLIKDYRDGGRLKVDVRRLEPHIAEIPLAMVKP